MFKYLTRAAVGALLLALLTLAPKTVFAAACTCQAGGVGLTNSVAVPIPSGEFVACTTSSSACTINIPGGTGLHHLEFQNQCSNTAYFQFNGVTAVANQGLAVFQASSPAQDEIYDITNGAAAIPPPGSSTGIGLVPNGPLSVIGGTCSLDVDLIVY